MVLFWKTAGLTYLQYCTIAASALRRCVKTDLVSKYAAREEVHFKRQFWKDGKPLSEKVLVEKKATLDPQ